MVWGFGVGGGGRGGEFVVEEERVGVWFFEQEGD